MTEHTSEVVITGVGPVTSIGVGVEALWDALASGRIGARQRVLPVDVGRTVEMPVASMPPVDEVPGLGPHMEFVAGQDCPQARDLAYALLAIELAMQDANLEYDHQDNNIGVIQAFEAPGMESTVGHLLEMCAAPPPTDGPPSVYDALAPSFYNMQPFVYVHLIGKALGLHGFSTSVHNACASGAFAIEAAAQRIRSGAADVMIVAGGEAFDTAARLEWFRRLELYAREPRMCPFDRQPTGFYVGEGGGALVLESRAHAARRGAAPYATYLGGAFSQQGWKQAIPDVRAGRLRDVIKQSLDAARVSPADLDLIIPHGAGTALSDGYEARCLSQALGDAAGGALVTALKPYFGHMLATCGIIEIVGALLAVRHQAVPALPGARPKQTTLPVPPATELTPRSIDTVLKLSTGFTGHDAAALFRKL